MDFSYKFSAVKGYQANREFYIAMVPLKYLERLFPVDELVLPEFRAQGKLNQVRIPEISQYILNNRDTYVFSALAGSIDGAFKFTEMRGGGCGILEIDMASKLLINDGQHRKAAIIEALKEDESLVDETISIVFYQDNGLARSQQMFSDLNKHAIKPSNSLSALYDVRDPYSELARTLLENIPFFNKYTEMESDTLGVNSPKFFTLNHLKNAIERVFKNKKLEPNDTNFALNYWENVVANISEWNMIARKEIVKKQLKENYIITLGVTLKALGRLGNHYYDKCDYEFLSIEKLQDIDWSRNNNEWRLRTIRSDGRVMSNELAIALTCNKIKKNIGIELNADDKKREKQIKDYY